MFKKVSDKFFKNVSYNSLRPYILPFLLSLVLIITMLSAYKVKPISLWLIPEAIVIILAFMVGEYASKNKAKGFGLICFLAAVIVIMYSIITSASDGGVKFFQWFFTGAETVSNKGSFIFAVILLYGSFFAIVIYYFSNVLYRGFFLMFVSIIPLLLHTKVLSDVHVAYVCFIVLLNVAIYGFNIRKANGENGKVIGNFTGIISTIVFLSIIISLAGMLPKKEKAKYYSVFESLFMEGSLTITMPEEFSIMNEYSGNADYYNELANRKLYDVYGEENLYLKRQTFDYYDFEKNVWYYDEYYTEPAYLIKDMEEHRERLNLEMLYGAIKEAVKNDPSIVTDYNISELVEHAVIVDREGQLYIQAENFPSISYIAPERTFDISVSGKIYYTRNGVIRNEIELNSGYENYRVKYYDEYNSRENWTSAGGSRFDIDTSLEFLKRVRENVISNNLRLVVESYISECEYAISYRDDEKIKANNELISDRIRELALSVTAGLDNDYDKARALANYFHNNNFVYDLKYNASDDSPEYFLFQDKRGTCSDFASAYVLMARSIGLCARYVEGYKPTVLNQDVQVIRVSDSHAYPEVFIPNMGFIVFEPTISSGYSDFTINETLAFMVQTGANALRIIIIIVVIIMIIVFFVLLASPMARDVLFRIRILVVSNNKAVILIYNRLVKRSEGALGKNMFSLTPYELYEDFNRYGYDIAPLVDMVEHITYGNGYIPKNAKTLAMRSYMISQKCIRHVKRQKKKK